MKLRSTGCSDLKRMQQANGNRGNTYERVVCACITNGQLRHSFVVPTANGKRVKTLHIETVCLKRLSNETFISYSAVVQITVRVERSPSTSPFNLLHIFFIAPNFLKSNVKMASNEPSTSSRPSTSSTQSILVSLAQLKEEYLSELSDIGAKLERYNCLPKTFAGVQKEIEESKKKLAELQKRTQHQKNIASKPNVMNSNWITTTKFTHHFFSPINCIDHSTKSAMWSNKIYFFICYKSEGKKTISSVFQCEDISMSIFR